MNTREIKERIEQLQLELTNEKSNLAVAQEQEKSAQEINDAWLPACNIQNIETIKRLLLKMNDFSDELLIEDVEFEVNIGISSENASQYDRQCFKNIFLQYAMLKAIYKDNKEMLSIILDAYLK